MEIHVRLGADKEGNINVVDAASILGAQLDRGFIGDDIFTAVPGDVVVYAALKRLQQGGFSVEASAYDQCDTEWNSHAGNRSAVWKIEGNAQGFR